MKGPKFLNQPNFDQANVSKTVAVRQIYLENPQAETTLLHLIKSAPNWYILQKRVSYLCAFKQYICQKINKIPFQKPNLDSHYLNKAMLQIIRYVQCECFGLTVHKLLKATPDNLDDIIKKVVQHTDDSSLRKNLSDLLSLRFDSDGIFCIEGRLSRALLLTDEKYPIILPSRHLLTRLLIMDAHVECAHGGIQYTLMLTRRRFWVIKGLSSVRHYIKKCNLCVITKAHPIRQLMTDLPTSRMAIHKKPFPNTGCDYMGPFIFKESRSEGKAWGLLFTCMTTRAIHVELVTSLDLSSFIMAFS